MLRILLIVLLVVAALLGGGALYIYSQVRGLEVEQITDDVWVIFGVGGNVGVGGEGGGGWGGSHCGTRLSTS